MVYQFIDDRPPVSVAELAERLQRMSSGPHHDRKDEQWWNHTVRVRETGQAIGRLEATLIGDRAEVACLFGSMYWGHGYATEAMGWLHRQLCERTGTATFWATTRPTNARSMRLWERLGYEQVAEWPQLTSYDTGDLVYRGHPWRMGDVKR